MFSFCDRVEHVEEEVTLTIDETIPDDQGEYTIKVTNDKGIASSSAEATIVLEAPTFIEGPADVDTSFTKTAEFTCTVAGKPMPTVTWFADKKPLEEGPKYHMTFVDNVATLKVMDVSLDDSVDFTCTAENVAGEVTATARLTVQGIYL